MDLFNQPGIYTHWVEYEKYKEYHHTELNANRTALKSVYSYDTNLRKWISSLPMTKDKIDDFIRFFVTGCTTSSGEYRIVEMDKYTTNQFERNPNTKDKNYIKHGEPNIIYL